MLTSLILIGIIVVVGGYFVLTQRSLVELDERASNALSQIDVQLNSRWDAISLLAKMVEKYSKHEHDTLIETIAIRRGAAINTADDAMEQQSAMEQVLNRINFVVEQYPELKASTLYENTMVQINEFENKVRVSRQIYNDATTMMNRKVRQWPSSIVAGILGFSLRSYFKVQENKTDLPNV